LKPRDHFTADRIGMVGAARVFSNLVSPPVMFAVLGLILSLYVLPFWPALAWAAVYGFFVSLAPILLVLYLLKTGRIAELHMTNTRERHLPYLVAVLGSFTVLALLLLLDGPELLRCLALFNVLALVVIALINVYWLISFHVTAATAMTLILALVFGPAFGALLLPLLALVVVVRLYLRRHTVAQTAAGAILGTASVFLLSALGCFTG
jgi:MFS family permease